MGTTPFPKEDEPTPAVRVESGIREVIAGHPQGAVRRIILYAVLGLDLVVTGALPLVGLGAGVVLIVLLAATDQLA